MIWPTALYITIFNHWSGKALEGSSAESRDLSFQNGTGKKRKKMLLAIIAIIVAGILMVAALLTISPSLIPTSDQNHQILKAGDYLDYQISGSVDNDTFGSGTNITIMAADESGISFASSGFSLANIPDFGHDFKVYAGSSPYIGELIGNEKISTAFGMKAVKIYYEFDVKRNEVVLADVGMDSLITYRWTVSSASKTYQYSYELTTTNNTQISGVDKVLEPISITVLNTVSPTPCPYDGFGLFRPRERLYRNLGFGKSVPRTTIPFHPGWG